MKYYRVDVIVKVPPEEYNTWDSHCDETFHGPMNPKYQRCVTYIQIPKAEYDYMASMAIQTEEGGI